jgi:hypothetical protein
MKHLILLAAVWGLGMVFIASVPNAPVTLFAGLGMVLLTVLTAWHMRRDAQRPDGPSRGDGLVASALMRQQEQLDAIAVEVERIGEGQRFVTKLLAERGEAIRLPAAGSTAERHNTPH